MIGLGTIINVVAIVIGGFLGCIFGRHFSVRLRETLTKACGISVIFIGIAGAMEGMLGAKAGTLTSQNTMLVVVSLVLGALVGELINIEGLFLKFGVWLRAKTGNENDSNFLDGFIVASLTVCIGAMAIVGAIEDGTSGDYSVLAAKSVLDLIIVMILSGVKGIGCAFSAIPVLIFEGSITLLAGLFAPMITPAAMFNLSMVGSILIFCIGVNLLFESKIRVANFLPSLIFAAVATVITQ